MLSLLALSLTSSAIADQAAEPCFAPTLIHAVPAADLADVPLDTVGVLVFADECQGVAPTVRLLAAGVDVAATVDVQRYNQQIVVEVTPDAELLPDTAYELVAEGDAGDATVLPFTTGSALSDALEGTPELTLTDAYVLRMNRDNHQHTADGYVTPLAAPDGLSSVLIRFEGDEAIDQVLAVEGTGDVPFSATMMLASPADELCYSVAQQDAAGRRTEFSAPTCMAVTSPSGCDSTGGSSLPGAALLLALGAASMRRR